MTPEERQKRADWLRELGVPARFHDEIIDAPTKELIAVPGVVPGFPSRAAAVVVGLYGFFGLIVGWFFFARHVNARAATEAIKNGALLIHVNVGLGMLLLLFALVLGLGWIGADGARRYWVNGVLVDAAKAFDLPPEPVTFGLKIWLPVARLLQRAAVYRAKDKLTSDEFFLSVARFDAWLFGFPALLLITAGICLTVLESN